MHLRRALAAPCRSADRLPIPAVRLELLLPAGWRARPTRATRAVRGPAIRRGGRPGAPARDDADRAAPGLPSACHRLGCAERAGSAPDHVRLLEEAAPAAWPTSVVAARGPGRWPAWRGSCTTRGTRRTGDQRPGTVAADAVNVARQLDDPATLAVCLLALHDTSWSVGSAGERIPIVAEMLDLARLAGDRELLAQAQLLQATALLELGDPTAPGELEHYCRAAEDLGHARGRWRRCRAGPSSRSWPVSSTRPQISEGRPRLGEEIGEPDTPGVRDTLLWELARFREGWSDFATEGHLVPPGHWPPIRRCCSSPEATSPEAQSVLAGYSLDHDRRHGVPATTAGCR